MLARNAQFYLVRIARIYMYHKMASYTGLPQVCSLRVNDSKECIKDG